MISMYASPRAATAASLRYLAKGTHVVQAAELIDERLGEGTFNTLVRAAGGQWGHVLPSLWYDLDVLLKVLSDAAPLMGKDVETLTREIATRNARHDLTSVYRVFLRILRPTIVLGFVPRIWETYFRFGSIRVVVNGRGRFELVCHGIPERYLAWHRGGCLGFLRETILIAGGAEVSVTTEKPEPDGKPGIFRVVAHATYR